MAKGDEHGGQKKYGDRDKRSISVTQTGISPGTWQNICSQKDTKECDRNCRGCQYFND